jgi:hemolysin activation/secretion protein
MLARLCRFAAALAVTGIPTIAAAQIIPPSDLPGRERERFVEPPAARAQPRGTVIALPSTVAPAGAESVKLMLRGVEISGSTIYSGEDFTPLYVDLLEHEVSLQAVYDLAQRITARYGRDGYVLSRAVVPPQNLNARGAVVRIQVIEGYIDRVVWPQKLARYRNFFTDYEAKIVADRPANIRTLERYLLLLGDLPGFKVSTKLEPSKTQLAASTLVVEVTEKPVDLGARIDNHGSKSRGPTEFLASTTLNNLLASHEAFTATFAGAIPLRELQYAALAYRQVLNSEGLTGFANASYSWGKPGRPVDPILDYTTRSLYGEAGFSYPLIRARERNLLLSGLAFVSDADSDVFAEALFRDRLRGFRLKADADWADPLRGINQFNFTFSQGIQGLGSTDNENPLASRVGGKVDESKIEFSFSRLQPLFWNLSAFGSAYAQHAFTPLLSPELCGYGGRFYGRAYDPSELVGDSCWMAVGELRADMPMPPGLFSLAQLYVFADHGRLTNINSSPVFTPDLVKITDNVSEGSSAGGGVRFGWNNQFNTDLYVAKSVAGPRDDTRVFFIVTGHN